MLFASGNPGNHSPAKAATTDPGLESCPSLSPGNLLRLEASSHPGLRMEPGSRFVPGPGVFQEQPVFGSSSHRSSKLSIAI